MSQVEHKFSLIRTKKIANFAPRNLDFDPFLSRSDTNLIHELFGHQLPQFRGLLTIAIFHRCWESSFMSH